MSGRQLNKIIKKYMSIILRSVFKITQKVQTINIMVTWNKKYL